MLSFRFALGLKIRIGDFSDPSALALRVISLSGDVDLDGSDFQVGYLSSADAPQFSVITKGRKAETQ